MGEGFDHKEHRGHRKGRRGRVGPRIGANRRANRIWGIEQELTEATERVLHIRKRRDYKGTKMNILATKEQRDGGNRSMDRIEQDIRISAR